MPPRRKSKGAAEKAAAPDKAGKRAAKEREPGPHSYVGLTLPFKKSHDAAGFQVRAAGRVRVRVRVRGGWGQGEGTGLMEEREKGVGKESQRLTRDALQQRKHRDW